MQDRRNIGKKHRAMDRAEKKRRKAHDARSWQQKAAAREHESHERTLNGTGEARPIR